MPFPMRFSALPKLIRDAKNRGENELRYNLTDELRCYDIQYCMRRYPELKENVEYLRGKGNCVSFPEIDGELWMIIET